MESIGIMITGTPEQIAEGLKRFAELHVVPKKEPEFPEKKMSIAEGAKYIGISYKTLCTRIRDRKIRVHGSGRNRFVYKNELIEDFENLHVKNEN